MAQRRLDPVRQSQILLDSTRRRGGDSTAPAVQRTTKLLFLLLPPDHNGPLAVIAQLEMRAAGQTDAVGRRGAEDAQADAADEADVDDVAMAEAGGAEVDGDAGGQDEVGAGGLRGGQEGGEEVLEEGQRGRLGFRRLEAERDVDTLCRVRGLLEEDGRGGGRVRQRDLADVHGDGEALAGEDAVHERDVLEGYVGGG